MTDVYKKLIIYKLKTNSTHNSRLIISICESIIRFHSSLHIQIPPEVFLGAWMSRGSCNQRFFWANFMSRRATLPGTARINAQRGADRWWPWTFHDGRSEGTIASASGSIVQTHLERKWNINVLFSDTQMYGWYLPSSPFPCVCRFYLKFFLPKKFIELGIWQNTKSKFSPFTNLTKNPCVPEVFSNPPVVYQSNISLENPPFLW